MSRLDSHVTSHAQQWISTQPQKWKQNTHQKQSNEQNTHKQTETCTLSLHDEDDFFDFILILFRWKKDKIKSKNQQRMKKKRVSPGSHRVVTKFGGPKMIAKRRFRCGDDDDNDDDDSCLVRTYIVNDNGFGNGRWNFNSWVSFLQSPASTARRTRRRGRRCTNEFYGYDDNDDKRQMKMKIFDDYSKN